MKVWGTWYGGSSYITTDPMDYLETFADIATAKECLRTRCHCGYWQLQTFNYVNQERTRCHTPCVDQDSTEIHVYLSDPREARELTPDRIIRFGPRGGIRVERVRP